VYCFFLPVRGSYLIPGAALDVGIIICEISFLEVSYSDPRVSALPALVARLVIALLYNFSSLLIRVNHKLLRYILTSDPL
jgi:hypothetical protein